MTEINVSGYIMTKNGVSGFIKTAAESLSRLCDTVYVVDGGSTDGTYEWLNQSEHVDKCWKDTRDYLGKGHLIRRQTFQKLYDETESDYIIALDDDEQIINPEKAKQKLLEKNRMPISPTLAVRMYHLWNENQYRTDGEWLGDIQRPIIYSNNTYSKTEWIGDCGAHCSRIPVGKKVIESGINIVHYGWRYKNNDKRVKKMESKKERDKKLDKWTDEWWEIQNQHYNSIYEEPELEEIPGEWKKEIVEGFKDEQEHAVSS